MSKRNLIIAVIFISVLFAVQASAQNATSQTFQNTAAITINDNGNASLYPSNITVSGISSFTRMEVRLNGFSHTYPDDVDIILVGPNGQRAILMSDAGGNPDVTNINLTFSQTSNTPIPDATVLNTGTFRPTNYANEGGVLTDNFPAPGPGLLTEAPADLFVFNGTSPNGVWNLYVVDDAGGDTGSISGGWTLTFTVPQIFTVNSIADTTDGTCDATNCTLREAITAAQNGDLINFSSLFNTPQTINLLTALPDITRSITIQGTGANLLTVRRDFNAATNFRIFTIPGGVTNGVHISGMIITGGNAGSGVFGGGINSQSHLTLTNVHVTGNTADVGGGVGLAFADGSFTNCTFSNNTSTNAAGSGGGIFFQGDGGQALRVINSTVSGNHSVNGAGGIFNINSRLEITNSTITNNTAVSTGGVLTFTQGAGTTAATTLRNTIVAGNSPNNLTTGTAGGGAATFQTLGFNLSDNYNGVFTPLASDITSATPRLAPLALYGGQTPTHALLHASPAINAGDASGQTTDQRGVARVFGAQADIGAVEMRPLVVTSTANGGAGSLRNILGGGGNAVLTDIQFENGLFSTPQTITLTGGQLNINFNANIIAPGANLLTISGNNNSRVFQIANTVTATLSGITITGGNAIGDSGGGILNVGNLILSHSAIVGNSAANFGGGINVLANANTTVTNSTISGNTANIGGGIVNDGTTFITNSTISGNTANSSSGAGGGIDSEGNLTVTNSTITGNQSPNGNNNGGGILTTANSASITNCTITLNSAAGAGSSSGVFRSDGTITIRNSIIAGNVNNATQPDVVANGGTGITSNGFNLIGNRGTVTFNQTGDQSGTGASPLNPQLGALQNNGGTTATHALLAGSPALDRGNSSGATSDQRGLTRPIDLAGITNTSDGADIGALEAQTAPTDAAPTAAPTAANVTGAGGTTYNFSVTYTDDTAINVSTINTGDVTVNGPNGFTATPTFVSVNINTNGTPRTATYSFTPPGGSWDIGDNGTYTIVMNTNQVQDNTGNPVAAGNIGSFTVNIPPTISINDVSQNEGNSGTTAFTFNVTLSNPSSQTVTVSYATADGTANAPSDYTAIGATTLTFNPNETSKQVTVLVNGDTTVEPNETFFMNLSNPTNATISDNQGVGTIINDDAGCSYSLSPTGNTSVTSAGVSSSFNVVTQTGCAWTAVSSNVQWISITPETGSGNGTVSYCIAANGGQQRTGTITVAGQTFTITQAALSPTATTKRVAADFDGDNRSDLSIFRPSPGQWWYQQSSNNNTRAFGFGASTDKIVPADYDGDGKIDIATFTPSTGMWSVLRSSNLTFFAAPFGANGDIPTPGDFDGDGKADLAVYRPSETIWYINRTGSCGVLILQFGLPDDIPVVGDYDGDGMADVAIFRPNGGSGQAEWWIRRSTAGVFATPFGIATDKPVQGDYTGDGKTDIAFYRPTVSSPTNNWFVLRSDDLTFYAAPFGLSTDIPVPGDYEGDGKYDIGVFRPSDTNWFILRSVDQTLFAQQFGAAGDKPIASAFIP